MFPPQANTLSDDAGHSAEYPIRFRFSITWSSLSTQSTTQVKQAALSRMPRVITAPLPPTPTQPTPTGPSADKWEMVIPKMARPAGRPAPARLPQPVAPAALQAPAAVPPQAPIPPAPRFQVSQLPSYREFSPALYTLSESFWSGTWHAVSLGWKLILIAAALIIAAVWVWLRTDSPRSSTPAPSAAPGGENFWIRRNAYLAGSKQGRQLLLYGPSREESDYRLEFSWIPDPDGVGVVFRTRDSGSYYAARLHLTPSKELQALIAEHFSVMNGIEGRHAEKLLTAPRAASALRVRMDVTGPSFTLYVQDSPVEYWTDAALGSGGIGFFEERRQHPVIQGIRFTFFKKGSSQTMVVPIQ